VPGAIGCSEGLSRGLGAMRGCREGSVRGRMYRPCWVTVVGSVPFTMSIKADGIFLKIFSAFCKHTEHLAFTS